MAELRSKRSRPQCRLTSMANATDPRLISQERLFQQMSEVISLREQVAQAELAAHVFGAGLDQRDKGDSGKNPGRRHGFTMEH